jgi:hypothetical protein
MYSSRKRAHEAVQTALKEIAEESRGSAEELRTLELARLESLQMSVWPSTRRRRSCTASSAGTRVYREPTLRVLDGVGAELPRRAHAQVATAVLTHTAPQLAARTIV